MADFDQQSLPRGTSSSRRHEPQLMGAPGSNRRDFSPLTIQASNPKLNPVILDEDHSFRLHG
jgi:hypothetical protein